MARSRHIGLACLLVGAVLFSTKAIFIKLAYQYDVSSISLLGLRMLSALPFLLLIGFWRGRGSRAQSQMSTVQVTSTIAIGLMGYYLASYTDFLGLRYVSAGMERVILFTYPTMVLLLQRLLFGTPIRPVQWLATGMCYVGIALAFSGSDWTGGGNFGLGAALVLLSALLYSGYVVGTGRLAPAVGTIRFTSLALVAAAAGVVTHVLISGEPLLGLALPVYVYGLVMGVFCTVVPSYLVTEGVKRLGPGDAAIVGAVGPVATIVLEYLVLHEAMNVLQGLGALLIIGGVVVIGRTRS